MLVRDNSNEKIHIIHGYYYLKYNIFVHINDSSIK